MDKGARRIRSVTLMVNLIFKSKLHHQLTVLGVYIIMLTILYYKAPTLIDMPLTFMATGFLLLLFRSSTMDSRRTINQKSIIDNIVQEKETT